MQNRKKRAKYYLSKMYYKVIKELVNLAGVNGAQTICLDILEQMPVELQPEVIREIATSKKPEYIPFLQLVYQEKQGELREEAYRALTKYKYLGHEADYNISLGYNNQDFIITYGSQSRLIGNCILVFVSKGTREYIAHYFHLHFNHLGVKEYFQHRSKEKEVLLEGIMDKGLVQLSFEEGQALLMDAYQQNIRYGTNMATGFSQFGYLLNMEDKQEAIERRELFNKLKGKKITPHQAINAYLLALKNMDSSLVYDLATPSLQKYLGDRKTFIKNWCHPLEKYTFIKSLSSRRDIEGDNGQRISLIALDDKEELKEVVLEIGLEKTKESYFIAQVDIKGIYPIGSHDPLNPLNHKVYACVYKIGYADKIREEVSRHEFISITGEFENGVCYKWFKNIDPLEYGLDVSKSVYGEFILTETELIVFSSNLKDLSEVSMFLQNGCENTNIQLVSKTKCSIRNIYRVITEGISLSEKLNNRCNSYLIPKASRTSWYQFCAKLTSELKGNGCEIFHFYLNNISVEVIFYEQYGIINLFNNPIEFLSKKMELPQDQIFPLNHILSPNPKKNSWEILKLIKNLKNDPGARIYLPIATTTKEIASKLQLLIT